MVGDGNAPNAVFGTDRDLDRAALRRVDERIAHEVAEHLAKAGVVAGNDHRAVGGEADLALGRDRARIGQRVPRDGRKIDRSLLERAALVEARENKHVVHEPRHADRFLLDAAPRKLRVGARLCGAAAKHLRIAADRS